MRVPVLLMTFLIAIAGCSPATKAIRENYTTYNHTIHYNESQQMLLNLVRLRYRESTMFLKVGAVSTSYVYERSAGANVGRSFGDEVFGVNVGVSRSERPTVTYTPIDGSTFVRQMLAEVSPSSLVLLFRSGWPIETLLQVLVEKVGTRINHHGDPSYEEFLELTRRLQEAQDAGRLEIVAADEQIFLRLLPESGESEEEPTMIALDGIQLRSFADIMFFLGKNTQVPDEHADQVRSATPNGWLDITYSKEPPEDALVWVEYNDYIYSIGRTDIRSKDTFALLKLVFQMQAGDIQSVQPILTLPIATP